MQLPWQHSQRKPDVGPLPAPPWPPSATFCLLALQGVVYVAQMSVSRLHAGADPLFAHGALSTGGLRAWQLWQLGTHIFLTGWRAAAWLLPASALALGLAGRPLEAIIGRRHLFQLFLLAGIGGGLGQMGIDLLLERDVPLAGAAAAAAGVLWALACITPRAAVLPGVAGMGWLKVMHAALGVSAAALLGAEQPPGAAILFGCLAGGLYMRGLGFGRREVRVQAPAAAPAAVPSASLPGWSPSPPSSPPVMTAPTATAAEPVVMRPRFSDRERRMSAREYVSEQIDPILDKISLHGIGSLTEEDRRALAKGREKLALAKL